MDALSDVLRTLRLKGGVFLHGELSGRWCLDVKVQPDFCAPYLGEAAHIVPYHFVVDGRMFVRLDDGEELELGPGESVLFPRNDRHRLGSDLDAPTGHGDDLVRRPVTGGLATITLGDGEPLTRIVCGFLAAEHVPGNPVLEALPAALRLDAREDRAAEWIRSTFAYAAAQIAAGRPGSETVMSKLSELLFVEAVQRYVDTRPPESLGWLAALRDPFVSRALALMHARIAHPWTVEELGREVGLSRSALAARFGEVLGVPPVQYLASWRIHVAAHELVHTGKPIAQVADEVGYESEASFTRAFKRLTGMPPAAWRRERTRAGRGA